LNEQIPVSPQQQDRDKRMKMTFTSLGIAGLLALGGSVAQAAVVQSIGSGSAVGTAQYAANFEGNTTLANNYSEGSMLFSHSGAGSNAGCGYAGVDCVAPGDAYSLAFSGNYFATDGSNAYVDIKSQFGSFSAIEFAVDTGYLTLFGYWQTYRNSVLTGSGNFTGPAGGVGTVLGLSDAAGFDEVRFFSFSTAGKTSGFSAPAIDSVRAAALLPEPGSLALVGAALVAALVAAASVRQRRA
jgi:hypothetical protein